MKTCIINGLMFLGLVMIFPCCNTLKTSAPSANYKEAVMHLKPSCINVPVEIDMKDLEKKINNEIKGVIYEDNSFENNNNDNLKVKAIKKDNFTLSLIGNELSYRIPLKLVIQLKKFIVLPEITAELAFSFKTAFTINNDWTVTTKTTSTGYEWLSSPTVNISGYDISIQYIADIILHASKGTLEGEIDKAIKNNIKIKDYIQNLWVQLFKPVKVSDEYNAWLRVSPSDIMATQFMGKNNKLTMGVGVKSINEIFVGNEPKPAISIPLPNLTLTSTPDSKFLIFMNADIDFNKINELAKKELEGKTFTEGKKSVVIKKLNIYGTADKFVVGVEVTGSVKGNVFLTGKAVYNPANRSIEIKSLDYDIDTKQTLLKSADWLLHNSFIKMIEPKLVYSISDYIDQAEKMINDYLNNYTVVKGITIKGKLNKIDIDNIYFTKESVKVVIFLEGRLSLMVNGLSD